MAISAVQKSVIEQAMHRFDLEFRSSPSWAEWQSNPSHKFAIHSNDSFYPTRKIISLATDLPVSDFLGGDSINGYLHARGFQIVDLRQSPTIDFQKSEIYDRRSEIHRPFGGSFQSGISPSKRVKAIFLFAGASGEQFGYLDEHRADGVYTYTGEGQTGDMQMARGNLAVRDHARSGRALHLFQSLENGNGQRYIGEFSCSAYTWEEGLDKTRTLRKIVKFHLVPVENLLTFEATTYPEQETEVVDNSAQKFLSLREKAVNAAIPLESAGGSIAMRTIYHRSKQVKDYVLLRAGGHCESCGKCAPFISRGGHPYLEPHHINRLSDGGIDHPLHVAAICPDCHREIHFGVNGNSKNEVLRELVIDKERALG